MPPLKSLIGQRFGRLVVLAQAASERRFGHRVAWLCQCDCGRMKAIVGLNLTQGKSQSCGCLKSEIISRTQSTHHMTDTPTYRIWCAMKTRCLNTRAKTWPFYGGRGIRICEAWNDSFEAFFADMGPRPSANHSLDRIDNSGNYERSNCRWANHREQMNNTRANRSLTLSGRIQTLAQWARTLGLAPSAIRGRLQRGWTIEQTLTTPPLKRLNWTCRKGERHY